MNPERPSAPRNRSHAQRGNTLMLSLILMGALALLAAGAIALSGVEMRGATSQRDFENLAACARGGRELLMSQFRLSSRAPTSMKVTLPGSDGDLLVATGHYDTPTNQLPLVTVQLRTPDQVGSSIGAEDISNKVIGGSSAQPATFTVICQDALGRRQELEFTFGFGF